MKKIINKFQLLLTISLTLSSCSCCKVKEAPKLTTSDELFFQKYAIGDTIKLNSDSISLDIVIKNISYDKIVSRGGGGFAKRQCQSVAKKSFDLKLIIRNDKNILDTLLENITISKTNSDGIIQDSKVVGILHDTITIQNVLYINVYSLSKEYATLTDKYYRIFYNEMGIILATNKDNSIVFK